MLGDQLIKSGASSFLTLIGGKQEVACHLCDLGRVSSRMYFRNCHHCRETKLPPAQESQEGLLRASDIGANKGGIEAANTEGDVLQLQGDGFSCSMFVF